jgi:hypothetical protein
MTPELVAKLVARWVRFCTRDVSTPSAGRRVDEIDADLHDHIAHERANGGGDRRIAFSILSRMVRGVTADVSWRAQHAKAITYRSTSGGPIMQQPATGPASSVPGRGVAADRPST